MSDFKIVKLLGSPVSITLSGPLNLQGDYDNATAYSTGDLVTYQGSSYAALGATTGNPPTDPAFWQLIAEKGDEGPQGPAGTTDHLALTNIGTNSHVQIDSHIASTSNPHSVTKSQVGLGNVDNTSDASKPVSTATQTALDLKADQATTYTKTESDANFEPKNSNIQSHISSTSNPHSVNKSQVGLGNVDNTSDADKPISTTTQTALDLKADDNEVVKLTGPQTIAGVKTFSNEIRRISLSGDAHIEIDAPLASNAKDLQFRTAGVRRFTLRTDGGADNFTVRRYNDLGVFLDNPISINRSTGVVTINDETMGEKLNLSGGVIGGELVIEGDLGGTGSINLKPQSTSPATPTSGVRLYASQDEHLSWRGQSGQSASLNTDLLSDERVYSLPDSNGTLILNPMTTDGDIIYRSGGSVARLPVGLESQGLKVVSGLPSWSYNFLELFGAGTNTNLTLSGALTLSQDVYYSTLTLNAGSALNTNGYRIFCKTLDLSNAPAFAIRRGGNNGNSASSQNGGGASGALVAATLGLSGAGGAGATGVVGAGPQAAASGSLVNANGGGSGAGGAGGNGTPNAGGASRAASTATTGVDFNRIAFDFFRGAVQISGGAGAPGGSAGGGDGVNLGRGGGGGASGAGVVAIYAHRIITSASTASQAITCIGGNGGNGASAAAGNVGGGGGGAGSGGGFVYIMYSIKEGPVITNLVDCSGGNGGNGGNGFGTGLGGRGGGGGTGGQIVLYNVTTATGSQTFGAAGAVGGANTGVTGGTGGTGGLSRASL